MPVYSMTNAHPITLNPAAPGTDYTHTFVVDWDTNGNELQGEPIAISEWTIEPSLTVLDESNTTTTATLVTTGLVNQRIYRFRNQVTTTNRLTKEPVSFYVQGGNRMPVTRAPKDTDSTAVKAYLFKWGRVLGSTGTISDALVTVAPSGMQIIGKLISGQDVYVWVKGATHGQLYTMTCTITKTGVGKLDPSILLIRGVAR